MDKLRQTIQGFIIEALDKQHFKDRVHDRLQSDFTTFRGEKQEVKNKISNDIEFLKKVNFPGQDNIGILLFKGGNKYTYEKDVDGKLEKSSGNFVWIVIRANDLETIVFGDHTYVPKNTQIQINIDRLKKYIEMEKNMDFNLTEKDLRKIQTWNPEARQQPGHSNNDEIIVNINGVKYVFDKEKKELYKKNKTSEKLDVTDVFDSLPEDVQEKILNYL